MFISKRLLLILTFVGFVPFAAYSESPQKEFYEEYYKDNFNGWKGIVFICNFDTNDLMLEKICQRAIDDIELLAVASKVNIHVAKPNDYYSASFTNAKKEYLGLEYKLLATQIDNQYAAKAVSASLTYSIHYSNAVENDAKTGSVMSKPRSGDLVFWEKPIIGIGTPSEIVTPFSDGAETLLKRAFTLFLKYAK